MIVRTTAYGDQIESYQVEFVPYKDDSQTLAQMRRQIDYMITRLTRQEFDGCNHMWG